MAPIPDGRLPPQAKGLVFDCDGTVLDTMTQHWKAWKYACAEFGIVLTLQRFVELAGTPTADLCRIILKEQGREDVDPEDVIAFKKKKYFEQAEQVTPIESVVDIVRAAKAKGIPCAIASGGIQQSVVGGLTHTGLLSLFDAVVTAEHYKNPKPAPDCFLLAAEQIGVDPKDCVGYEDAVLGMQSIRDAGFLAAIDVTHWEGYPTLADD